MLFVVDGVVVVLVMCIWCDGGVGGRGVGYIYVVHNVIDVHVGVDVVVGGVVVVVVVVVLTL